jgi:hypothetical protein
LYFFAFVFFFLFLFFLMFFDQGGAGGGADGVLSRLSQLENSARRLAAAIRQLASDLDRDERETPPMALAFSHQLEWSEKRAEAFITERWLLVVNARKLEIFSPLENKTVLLHGHRRGHRDTSMTCCVTETGMLVMNLNTRLLCVSLAAIQEAMDHSLSRVAHVRWWTMPGGFSLSESWDDGPRFVPPNFVVVAKMHFLVWVDLSSSEPPFKVDLLK